MLNVKDMFDINVEKMKTELESAMKEFPEWPVDPIHAAAILNEETGEVIKSVLEYVYEPSKGATLMDIEKELVQTMAMSMRMLINIKHYKKIKSFEMSIYEVE